MEYGIAEQDRPACGVAEWLCRIYDGCLTVQAGTDVGKTIQVANLRSLLSWKNIAVDLLAHAIDIGIMRRWERKVV